MYKFLAMRIHDGYMTWDDIKEKKYFDKVQEAYTDLYGDN